MSRVPGKMIYPYVKNDGVFVCPDADETPKMASKEFVTTSNPTNPRRYVGVTVADATKGGDGTPRPLCRWCPACRTRAT